MIINLTTQSEEFIPKKTSKNNQKQHNLKYLNFFAMTFVTCLLTSNVLGPIPINVFGLILPGGGLLFPLSFLLDNIITEVYGYKHSRAIIWYAIICHGIMAFFFTLTALIPSTLPYEEITAFRKILFLSPVVFSASLISIIISQHLNSMVLSKMKRSKLINDLLFLRCLSSTLVAVTVDSLIFVPIIFSNRLTSLQLIYMIICTYVVKVVYEFVFYPVTKSVIYSLKTKEGIDVIDFDTSYTPFSLDISYTEKELIGNFSK